jgi:hypothetical protein
MNMTERGTFFLNWDFTEIGMQTPMIHMNLKRMNERMKERSKS